VNVSWSVKVVTIRGIPIRIHVTFLFIVLWAAFNWGILRPGGWQGMAYGVVFITLIFLCVVLHELAHSLVAQAFGVKVRGITLLPIGGVSQMESIPRRPIQELLMSLAGPATNLVLGVALGLVAAVVMRLWGPPIRTLQDVLDLLTGLGPFSLLLELVLANISLAVFNLVPAFPMDGGRVLRAFLALGLDYVLATQIAVAVGQGLALLLGLWGFFQGNLLFILIAVFVYLGAEQEGSEVRVRAVLRETQACQILSREPMALLPTDTLARALDLTFHSYQTDFPVLHGGQLVGILTREDLLRGLRAYNSTAEVREAMRSEYPVAPPSATLSDLRQQMANAGARVVAIVDRGVFQGLLSQEDIGEAFLMLSAAHRAPRPSVASTTGCEPTPQA
jgi:Zn-dependent protease/CBS domain-containing protein